MRKTEVREFVFMTFCEFILLIYDARNTGRYQTIRLSPLADAKWYYETRWARWLAC